MFRSSRRPGSLVPPNLPPSRKSPPIRPPSRRKLLPIPTNRQTIYSYDLTISTFRKHRHFQRTSNAELFLATLQRYRSQGKFLIHAVAVIPDHIHLLLSDPGAPTKCYPDPP